MTETATPAAPVTTTASWLYAVLPADAAPHPDLAGVAGESVRLVTHAALSAVVGSVPRHWLGRDPVGAATDELARLVHDHHRVVAWFLPHAPVVPLRLGSAFQDDDRVRSLLHERAEQLQVALERVRGRAEWGLRAHLSTAEDEEPEPEPTTNRPGTTYLLRRKQERARQQRIRAAALAAVARLEAELTPLAAAVAHPRSNGASRTEPAPLLRNTTYLVDHVRLQEFQSVVRQHAQAEPGLQWRLTGPWPAYSFVSWDGEAS